MIIGDPVFIYHPVIFMGKVISKYEKLFRKVCPKSDRGELTGGFFTVSFTILTVFGVFFLIRLCLYKISVTLGFIYDIFLSSQMLAAKCLKQESMKVHTALSESLEAGRKAVSMIVGRDTENLTSEQVVKAAVETVAENTSDGEVSPMFYMFLFGPMGGVVYKAINTMDSMLGYKNDRYLFFGRFAARLDDIANFIPARIAAVFMILSAFLLNMDGKSAFRIFKRDRKKHKSPNSGNLEAVCAGALGIELGGDSYYFGKLSHKETLGDNLRKAEKDDIKRANKLLYMTSVLSFITFLGILILLKL